MRVIRSGAGGRAIFRRQVAALDRGMNRAGLLAVGSVKNLINRGNADGKNPSAPGEPPKKVSARLFQSITHKLERLPGRRIVKIGTNVKYARRLELGFYGTDAAGRTIRQAPRPFLRPGVRRRREQYRILIRNAWKRGGK